MSDKIDLRAACESAAKELLSLYTGLCETQHEEIYLRDLIERHIAPLLKSVRIAAIEEAARVCEGWDGNEPPDLDNLPDTWGWHAKDWAKSIRALKEQP